MTLRLEEMVGIFDNSVTDVLCTKIIEFFENNPQFQAERSLYTKVKSTEIKDTSIDLHVANFDLFSECKSILMNNFMEYSNSFDILKSKSHNIENIKIQKTNPGEGFHSWHYERVSQHPNRQCAFTTYLNDIEEGGETEFLYLRKRIKSVKGTTTIFPAGYTHTHRGNPLCLEVNIF